MRLKDGYTLMHEHMSIDLTEGDLGSDSFDILCSDLKQAYDYGVRNIIDMTNQSMGRDPEYVAKLMEETGINVVMSTGYYLDKFIGPYVKDYTVDQLAEKSIKDLTEGIDDSGIKAGVIGEIAWCHEGPTDMELKAWEAMCIAAAHTGAVVSTHPSRGIQQLPQAEYLLERGISPKKIVIGHIEFFPDDNTLKKLLDTGVYIGVDMVGKLGGKGDEYRADTVAKLKEWGRLSQVVLSLDLCRKQDLKSCGGYGYAHFFESFIPMLEKRGITSDDIELMLSKNPRMIFD